MTHEEEVRTVVKLIQLEELIENLQDEIDRLEHETYEQSRDSMRKPKRPSEPKLGEPSEPRKQKVKREYPDAESRSKKLAGCLPVIIAWFASCFAVWLLRMALNLEDNLFFTLLPVPITFGIDIFLNDRRKKDGKRIEESKEFQDEIAELDRQYNAKQAEYDAQYEEAVKQYEQAKKDVQAQYDADRKAFSKDLANYELMLSQCNEDKRKWGELRDLAVVALRKTIGDARDEPEALYDLSGLVPRQFRNLDALHAIYETISTSDFDVKAAITLYQQDRQRELDEQRRRIEQRRLREMQAANEEAAWQAARQHDLLEERNDIARRTRRDMDIANAAAMAQRRAQRKQGKRIAREEREREEKREMDQKLREWHEKSAYRQMRQKVIDENQERRRRGEPDLPVPPWR
ncbi:MAG: hypothetical protein LKJ49_05185 [Olsenella sp.]|jgi:hypothetical protein|nr:hypothetical protein [Olsenella sp.]